MGVTVLKKLVQQAKGAKDVITLEATVVTGFEVQAVDECKEKCKPIDVFKAKGRIFFNIKKESYPNVLKLRSIDNVYLVGDCFEELKLKRVMDDDLATIRKLVDGVNWSRSVPEWAEIVDFKGVLFPKCANRDPDQPLDESEPVCQNCKTPKKEGGEGDVVESEAGPADAKNAVEEVGTVDMPDAGVCSPKVLISDEETFQTPPDKCAILMSQDADCCQDQACTNNGTLPGEKVESMAVTDSAVEPDSSPEGCLSVKPKDETDDESAFHSAEEDLVPDELPASEMAKLPEAGDAKCIEPPAEPAKDEPIRPTNASNDSEEIKSADDIHALEDASNQTKDDKRSKNKKKKSKWDKKKEARAKRADYEAAKKESQSDTSSVADPDKIESSHSATNGSGTVDGAADPDKPVEKKMNYWQRRKEAKKAHDAMKKAAKPPPKAYIDDGILKFRVTCYRNGRHSFDSNDAAGNFGGVVNDTFHWTVDLTRYDINVLLVIEDDSAYVSYQLSKSSFHRRNIKNFGPTTLRATLCHGLLRFAEPKLGEIIMDPMCGGGSISIEGALAFPKTYHICGDVNDKCISRVADNIAFNSNEKPLMMDAFRWSVRRLPLQDQCIDVVVTDLPFGLRVGKQKDNTGLYTAALVELARVVRCGRGRASLLTYDRTAMIRALRKTIGLWREIQVNAINQVLDLAFDSVGARLAAAEGNGHVQVWDVKKGSELMFCLSGHTCEVSKVCFSPGGGQLLTASSDGTACLWSAKDGRALQILDGHSDEVFSCAFSYSGESILTASKDKTCRLWKRQPLIEE